MFTAAHQDRAEQIKRDVCRDFECGLAELNGEANHVHLPVRFPPKVAQSRLASSLTGSLVPITALRQYIEQQDRPA